MLSLSFRLLLSVSIPYLAYAQIGRPDKCPADGVTIDSCREVDKAIGDRRPPFKDGRLRSCRAMADNPNANVLCLEYRHVAALCPCVCQFILCDRLELGPAEEGVDALEIDAYDPDLDRILAPQDYFYSTFCFSGASTVNTTVGTLRLDELSRFPDAEVQVLGQQGLGYEPVQHWLHREHKEAPFLRVTTDNGRKITLTESHLIYRADCDNGNQKHAVAAQELLVGECVLESGDGMAPSRIRSITKETEQGLFAFVTPSGNVVVGGILASNYAHVSNHKLAHLGYQSFLKALRILPNALRGFLGPGQGLDELALGLATLAEGTV